MAHTPGPWLFRGKSNGVFTAPPKDTEYTYGDIIFQFDDVAEPSDGDLKLVLAAPDLLEALEDLLEGTGESPAALKRYGKAWAAIAKARGAV